MLLALWLKIFTYFQELILTSKESLSDNMDAVRKKFEVGYKIGKNKEENCQCHMGLVQRKPVYCVTLKPINLATETMRNSVYSIWASLLNRT